MNTKEKLSDVIFCIVNRRFCDPKDREAAEKIWDAYELAFQAHSAQTRKSGEPYIIHPVEVARIVAEDKELFMVNVALPQKAVETRMVEVIKWVNHFNFWCVLGAFMVNDRDGEIVFRITETMDEGAINKSIVDACLSTAMCTADNAYPDLIKAMFHEEEQKDAPVTEELPAEEIARFSHLQFNS